MASGNYSFEQMFQRSRNLESQLDLLLEILDEGVIGVNEKGKFLPVIRKPGLYRYEDQDAFGAAGGTDFSIYSF